MKRRRNPSESNPHGIDDRVWERIVGSETPTLSRIMFAAALDPLLLVDLDMIQPPRSFVECVQLGEMGTHGHGRDYLRGVLIKWAMHNSHRVFGVVYEIASWDIRLGVWCAAAFAESVLRFIPEREDRPRLAVEAARDWVFGSIDETAARAAAARAASASAAADANAAAARAAYAAAYAAYAAAYAASAAAYAAYAAASAARSAANAANAAARAVPYAADATRDVIVRAIESYPLD